MQDVMELKIAVAGFLGRNLTDFLRNVGQSTDVLLNACNNARLYAERLIDFEYSKVDVRVTATLLDGGLLSDAVLHSDGVTLVDVKKILTPFLPFSSGEGEYPVELWSRKKWNDRQRRRYEQVTPLDTPQMANITAQPFVLVQDGLRIFVAPADDNALASSFTVRLHVVRWLAPYTTGDETDFLLKYCGDWLMYRTVQELNFYLKEDERVQISASMVAEAWNSVIRWNNELTMASVDDVNLD